jgi:hypothetical protein
VLCHTDHGTVELLDKTQGGERIMPVHEWTRVTAGTFHDFHNAWITELRNVLNGGVLPEGYDALGEQRSGDVSPDVLTLHAETAPPRWTPETASDDTGMLSRSVLVVHFPICPYF